MGISLEGLKQFWERHPWLGAEVFIPAVFLVISVYMLIESVSFQADNAKWFPRLAGSIVAICSALILLQGHLPESIQGYVSESTRVGGSFDTSEVVESDDMETGRQPEGLGTGSVFVIGYMLLYIVLGYLIGFLLATPIFVAGYMRWFDFRWRVIAVYAIVSVVIVLAFVVTLNMEELGEGLVHQLLFERV